MWRKKESNHERRITALEVHIQDTEARYAELENRFNLLRTQVLDLHDNDMDDDRNV